MNIKSFLIMVTVLGASSLSLAVDQPLDDQEILNIESLYSTPATPPPSSSRSNESFAETNESVVAEPAPRPQTVEQRKAEDERIKNLTELNRLAPFSEVSVIQKKYLPKTERFQLFGGLSMITNSPWFMNLGGKVSIGYYFTEAFGLELSGMFLTNSEREVAKEIHEQHQLEPDKFVNTKAHYGVDIVWSPIYGKISFLNERIVPFDMYFTGGFGMSDTNAQEKTVPTFHLATGQIFALSKSLAFRWDFSWNFFQATPVSVGSSPASEKGTYNDLILTAGVSFFFPEAKYR